MVVVQRIVSAAPVRPQEGDAAVPGGRQVLVAIVFVAPTGCTWRQLPSSFGPIGLTAPSSEWSQARVWGRLPRLVLDELGAAVDWTGRDVRTRSTCGPSKRDLPGPKHVVRGKKGSKMNKLTDWVRLSFSIGRPSSSTRLTGS